MPPVVTGSIVAVIGLNLAPIAAKGAMGSGTFDSMMALMTVLCVGGIAVYTRGLAQRLLILAHAMTVIVPVAIILVAENLGHIKAVSAMTGQDLDGYLGRAFVGDGVATMLSGSVGGTGVTTYAENIGVMAATRIYSTLVFAFAAVIAIFLGFSPKFGAVIQSIPGPVLGGMSIVVFGLIAIAGARIWVVNQVDFSD
uniref:Pyrimidine utilization transport protein G n=1 Tax=Steinernema glaseri TaxID=37863 RepID=A0A1I7Y1J4_9BILA